MRSAGHQSLWGVGHPRPRGRSQDPPQIHNEWPSICHQTECEGRLYRAYYADERWRVELKDDLATHRQPAVYLGSCRISW
jgi:hypothetical protein